MSNLHQMLYLSGGSFKKAEQMAFDMILKGNKEIWLDLALLFHAQGKIDDCRHAQAEYAKDYPECQRLHFGLTWFYLYDGDLKKGLTHIEAGRAVGCLGEQDFSKFNSPKWNGTENLKNKTIILYGEGGAGDQIMGVRAAQWLADLGAKVIVGCLPSLMNLFSRVKGVHGVIEFDSAYRIHHDFWVPMMSVFRLCKCNWETLWTDSYLNAQEKDKIIWNRIVPKEKGIINVGLRWRGNPEFEHEQLRWFPPELMFKLTEIPKIKFWSLQKDNNTSILPDNVTDLEPLLGNWEQTAAAISRMDLVISSCTSIAHLSAAMNKPTWVIVPAMPYYPWARPGRTSHWYPSVTLFRQLCYGDWVPPFMEAYECLKRKVNPNNVIEMGLDEFCSEHKAIKLPNKRFVEGSEISIIEGLIRKYNVKTVLEIGINTGETAKSILDVCPHLTKYDGIEITEEATSKMPDHQQNERIWAGKKVGSEVEKDKKVQIFMSENGTKDFARDKEYDLVFIDGDHSFDWVQHDTKLAQDLKAKIIVWHDYGTEEGVTKFIDQIDIPVVRVFRTRIAYHIREN